jgi:glycosyltransferase involved in cell wall biosynthesis
MTGSARPTAQSRPRSTVGPEAPIRVLHVVARLGLGGSERMAQTLAEGLVARGVVAGILAVAGDNDPAMADNVRRQLREHGIAVFQGSRRQSAKRAFIEAPFLLPRAAATFRPDVVHLHTEIPEFAWAFASLASRRLRRLPVVRTIHNSLLWGGWGRFGAFAEGRLDGAPAAAVSQAAAEGFAAWRRSVDRPEQPVRVIYNGVACVAPDRPPARTAKGPIRLCFAGRFEAQKGVDILLDALEVLEPSGLAFEVAIYGTGRSEEEIRARARRLRRAIEIGPPIPDLRDRLASFDAIVMPSRFEGLPLLAIETICAQVPLLAADAPGLREALPPAYPGCYPPEDGPALAAKIAAFVGDPGPWHRAAPAAADWARARFSPDLMVEGYLDLYRDALGSP